MLVSDISHQVKTPVSNLKMVTDTLLSRPVTEQERKDFLQGIRSQTDKLEFLFQALVKTSRLETGAIQLEKKEALLIDTLAVACSGVVYEAEKKNISVSVDCPDDLRLSHDSKWTAEALFNLLDNAVKYTPAGGAICVSAAQWEMYWDLSWRFVGNIPYLRQHFKPYCMQTAGYDEPLHYSETAMDISAGPGGCVGGHIFDFFCICQVRTKENRHIVCNQR